MKILIDENLPRKLAAHLEGHECRTVVEGGWSGKKNVELLASAELSSTSLTSGARCLNSEMSRQRRRGPVSRSRQTRHGPNSVWWSVSTRCSRAFETRSENSVLKISASPEQTTGCGGCFAPLLAWVARLHLEAGPCPRRIRPRFGSRSVTYVSVLRLCSPSTGNRSAGCTAPEATSSCRPRLGSGHLARSCGRCAN
jgi:hypothetical protein